MAKMMKKHIGVEASFMVWNYKTARKSDPRNLDPNYLRECEWKESPWHATLLKFKAKFKDRGIPCFHIDFHGKRDRKKSKKHRIDIGMEPFVQHPEPVGWSEEEVEGLRATVKKAMDENLKTVVCRGKRVEADDDPYLHGWWGDDEETTLTHQAVLKGIPSLQLENPRSFRKMLNENDDVLEKYVAALAEGYKKAISIETSHGVVPKQTSADSSVRLEAKEEMTKPEAKSAGSLKAITPSSVPSRGTSNQRAFFVYGSLRPDDVSGMPWREDWLEGSISQQKATIRGRMYDDEYACVVLSAASSVVPSKNTVRGYIVTYPSDIYRMKLKDADEIEGCPDLYEREKTTATLESGDKLECWVYTRSTCSKRKQVASGDWVVASSKWQQHSNGRIAITENWSSKEEFKEVAYQIATDKAVAKVNEFKEDGFQVYEGQKNSKGIPAFKGRLSAMIDEMVLDATLLDRFEVDRQV